MTIGIPRALMYYYYGPLWKRLFENLGFTVALTEPTTKELIETGVKYTVSEICVPIKIIVGHVMKLLDMGVDYCFVPRLVSIHGGEYFCPKFLGLPDLIRHTLPISEEQLLTFFIDRKSGDRADYKSYQPLTKLPGVTPAVLKAALADAQAYFDKFRALVKTGLTFDQAESAMAAGALPAIRPQDLTLGVLGYVYNIHDAYVSMDILDRLQKMGVSPITFDTLEEALIEPKKSRDKKIYWSFTRKLHRMAQELLIRPDVDGLIHVTAFCCGPDSVLGKILEGECEAHGKPLMVIRVDEHNGESHVQTRVEAFVDMLARKKERSRAV